MIILKLFNFTLLIFTSLIDLSLTQVSWANGLELATKNDKIVYDHKYSTWNSVLEKFTSTKGQSTVVNYKTLKADPTLLNNYLKLVESVSLEQFNQFTSSQQLSFLINAYNALTVKLIIDNYPLVSIKKLGSYFKTPWKRKFFKLFGEE